MLFANVYVCDFRNLDGLRHLLALVDPHFHADAAKGGQRFRAGEVNISPQGLEWNPAFALPLAAGHFRAAQPPRTHDLDALRALPHGLADGALHRAAVVDAPLELVGDVGRHELRRQVGLGDLLDFHLHFRAGQLFQLLPQDFHLRALAANENPRLRRPDRHRLRGRRAVNVNPGDGGPRRFALDQPADREILLQQRRILALGREPARLPVFDQAQAKTDWLNFTTHL